MILQATVLCNVPKYSVREQQKKDRQWRGQLTNLGAPVIQLLTRRWCSMPQRRLGYLRHDILRPTVTLTFDLQNLIRSSQIQFYQNCSKQISQLEFTVPFKHKYGYIRDERSGVESYPYPVNEGQLYINLNPGRLFVQQPPNYYASTYNKGRHLSHWRQN